MFPGRTFKKSAKWQIFGQEWLQRTPGGAGRVALSSVSVTWMQLNGRDWKSESALAREGDSRLAAGYQVRKPVPLCGETSERLVPGPDRATDALVKMEKAGEKNSTKVMGPALQN